MSERERLAAELRPVAEGGPRFESNGERREELGARFFAVAAHDTRRKP